jgi:hypothetical protein
MHDKDTHDDASNNSPRITITDDLDIDNMSLSSKFTTDASSDGEPQPDREEGSGDDGALDAGTLHPVLRVAHEVGDLGAVVNQRPKRAATLKRARIFEELRQCLCGFKVTEAKHSQAIKCMVEGCETVWVCHSAARAFLATNTPIVSLGLCRATACIRGLELWES